MVQGGYPPGTGYWDDQKGAWQSGQRPLPLAGGSSNGSSVVYEDEEEDLSEPPVGSEEWWNHINPDEDDPDLA